MTKAINQPCHQTKQRVLGGSGLCASSGNTPVGNTTHNPRVHNLGNNSGVVVIIHDVPRKGKYIEFSCLLIPAKCLGSRSLNRIYLARKTTGFLCLDALSNLQPDYLKLFCDLLKSGSVTLQFVVEAFLLFICHPGYFPGF